MITFRQLYDAQDQGWNAYWDNYSLDRNPFNKNTELALWSAWNEGFKQGVEESERNTLNPV